MRIINKQYNIVLCGNAFLSSCLSNGGIESDIAYISVLERHHNFLLAVLVNSHTLTLAAASMTTGQPVIEGFM